MSKTLTQRKAKVIAGCLKVASMATVLRETDRTMPANAIVLLSCVKSKRSYRCSAGEMYTSPLFQKTMAYAQRLGPKRIFILSAKFGLLNPDDIICPYERTLKDKDMNAIARKQWAEDIILELRKHCDLDEETFIFLAGQRYRENIVRHLKHYKVPMEGLSFGKQLQWLKCQLQ